MLDLQSKPLTLAGNLINNNLASTTPIVDASTVSFNNTTNDQSIEGVTGVDFTNLTLAKASATTLSLNVPVSVSGVLNMANDGNLVLPGSTNDLTLGSAAVVTGSFSSNRMIVTGGTTSASQVIKEGSSDPATYDVTFPIGVGSNYTPVTINATAITTTGGSVGVRSINGPGSYPLIDGTRAIDRHFVLNLNSITNITGSVEFTYADSDIQGSEIDYLSWVYNGSLSEATNGVVTPGTNTFGSSNITITDASTEWVAGEAGAFFDKLYSVADGNWNVVGTWNTNPLGGGTSAVPSEFNEVEIQAVHTITSSADVTVAGLQLDGNLVLTNSATSYDFGILTGTGQLTFISGDLPTYNVLGTTFFDNGTVEFTDAGSSYSFSNLGGGQNYHNLIVSGTQNKTLSGSIIVDNDLTVNDVTLSANGNNISLGGSLGLNSGSIDIGTGTFALVGATAQSLPPGIDFSAGSVQFDNIGTKNITSGGSFTTGNFRILAASGSVDFNTGTDIVLMGNWSNASSSGPSIYSNVEDLILNDAADQNVAGVNTFHNLNISKNSSNPVNISGTITLDNGANGGNLIISADDVVGGTADFNLLGNWNNGGTFATTGTVNFNGTTSQTIAGDNTFGSLLINNTTGVNTAINTTTTILDDLTVTSGAALNNGSGTNVVFGGSGDQNINGAVTFLQLTKQGGGTLTLNDASTVNQALNLTDGIVNTTASDLLVLGASASVTGGSGTSYVNGPLQHTEDAIAPITKIFPFGSGTTYRPITLNLTQADAAASFYTGMLIETAPTDRTLPVGLERVSTVRHYTITQTSAAPPTAAAGIASANVIINYNLDDRSDVASTLRIAKSDGANWINLGGTGDTGDEVEDTFEAGTITSGTFTTFSDFVLASSEADNNPLPVELIDFQGISTADGVELLWTTASETNNSHFVVERLIGGSSFDEVVQVEGGGDSATPLYYGILDTQAPFGIVYYRLKQVDFDGTSTRSRTIAVIHNPQEATISIQPNPVENYQTVITAAGLATEQSVTIRITDMTGFMVRNYQRNTDSIGGITITLADLDALASGLYTITLVSDRFRHAEKLIIP